MPGDRDVDLKRLDAALAPATATMFDDFAARPDLVKGYIGPQGIKVRYLADPRVAPGTAWLTGANEPGRHATSVVAGRDFTPDGTIEAAEVRAGDPCPSCGDGELTIRRGIEIGHIFQLGRRYTDAFKVDVLGADGKPVRPTMGCYGIGISRAVAAIAEQHHDERGLIWPAEVAPADVHIVAAGKDGQVEAALSLAAELVGGGSAGAGRRPAERLRRRQVHRCRADRHPAHRRGRPPSGRGVRRGPRPPHGRAPGGSISRRARRC